EDIERDARLLKEEREASYAEYLADDAKAAAARGAAPGAPAVSSKTEPIDPRLVAQARAELAAAAAKTESPAAPEPAPAAPVVFPPTEAPAGMPPREAAARFPFHKDEAGGKKTPLVVGAAAVVVLAGGLGWFFTGRSRPPAPAPAPVPTTLSPEAVAAMNRVKELEQKLATLEAEQQAAQAKGAEDAQKKVRAQAKTR